MNKIYRLVWNATLGAWVAVCEFARARGKGKRGGARAARSRPAAGFAGRMGWRGCAAAVALACAGGSGAALAAGRGILAEIDGAAVTVGADGYGLDGGSTPDCGSVTTTDGCRDGDGVDMKWTVANSALNTLIEIKNGGALILGSGLELYVSGSGNAGASTVAVDGSGSEYRQTGGTANINHGFLLTGGALLTLSGGALNANVAGGANGGNIELRGAGTAMNVSGGALNMNGGAILLGIDNIGATAFTLSGGSVGAGKIQIGQASAMNVAGGQTSVGAIQVDGRLNLTGGAASLGTAGGSDAIAGAGQIDVSGGNTTIWGNAAGFTGTLTGTGGALTTKAAMGAATISLGSNTQYTAEGALAANSIVIETGADMVLHAAAPNANVTVRDAGSTLKVEGNGKLGAGKTLTVDDDGAATLVGNAADTLASPKAGHVVIGAGGGTLDLQGAGVLAKSLDSAGAGIVKITGTGAKTIDGDVSLTAGDTLDFSSASLGAPDPLLTITGDLSGAASVDAGMNFRNDPANNNLLAWDDPAGLDTVLLRVRGDYDGGLVIGSMGGAIVQTTSAKAAWESDAYYASKQGTVAQATVTGSGVSATCAAPSGSGGTDCAIGANSVLNEIAIEDGKTLALRPDGVAATTSDDNTLTAKLTQAPGDTGNVAVIAGTGAVTLSNPANDYTGKTTVETGTLKAGDNGVLGRTSELAVRDDVNGQKGVFDLDGHAQTVGRLNVLSGGTVLTGGGNLTIDRAQGAPGAPGAPGADPSRLAGNLKDTAAGKFDDSVLDTARGELNLVGETLKVFGRNADFTGQVNLEGGSEVHMLGSASGESGALGEGAPASCDESTGGADNTVCRNEIHFADAAANKLVFRQREGETDDGSASPLMQASQAKLANNLVSESGSNTSNPGAVELRNYTQLTLTGDNRRFYGTFDMGANTALNATEEKNLGGTGDAQHVATVNLNGGALNIAPAAALNQFTLHNALNGAGQLNVTGTGAANQRFDFVAATVGDGFAGVMTLEKIAFELNADNEIPLGHDPAQTTLVLGDGSVTTVVSGNSGVTTGSPSDCAAYGGTDCATDTTPPAGGGTNSVRNIDNLTIMPGSTLVFGNTLWKADGTTAYDFAENSFLLVDNLDVSRFGTIEIGVPNAGVLTSAVNSLNPLNNIVGSLLLQDDPNLMTKLIGAKTLNNSDTDENGTAGGLAVCAKVGGAADCTSFALKKDVNDWATGTSKVAEATYDLRATVSEDVDGSAIHMSGFDSRGSGLYLSAALTQVDIVSGKTLVLATDQTYSPGNYNKRDFSAKITGDASTTLQLGAAGYTETVSLSNPGNDYAGNTLVYAGTTLHTNNDNVLGNTRDLDIQPGAQVNLKHSQTVGHLGGGDGVTDGLINLTGALTVSGARNVDADGASQNNLANASDGREVAPDNGGKLTNNMLTGNGALTLDASNMLATGGGANAGFTGGIALANGSTLTVENADLIGNSGMFANGRSSSGEIAIDNSSRLLFDGDGSDGETLNRNLAGGGVVEVIGGADIVLAGNNKFVDPADIDPETGYPKAPGPWFTGKIVVGDESSVSASVAGTPSTCATAIGNIDCSQDVFGTAAVEVKAGGKLNLTSDSNYLFDHALTGGTADGLPIESANGGTPARDSVGVVKVDGVGAFNFASGSNYTGKVEMLIPAFTLDAGNANSLTNAWLEIEAGNTTRVQGSHTLNGLTLNGGDLVFDDSTPNLVKSANSLTVNYLDVESAASEVHLSVGTSFDANPDALNNDARWNLLEQDDVENMTDVLRVVKAQDGEFAANQLQVSQGGVAIDIAGGQLVDVAIRQNGATVATGSYAYKLNPSDGILLQHEMQTVTLAAGRALTLRPDDPAHQSERAPSGKAAAYDLKAKLTGAGGIIVDAGASSGGLVTLSGAGNDYTGATTVKDGTLRLMADEALGKTSDLIVLGARNDNILGVSIPPQATTAAVELNGHTQTVGHLSNGNATDYLLTPGATESAARLDLGDSGKLTVAAGGESFGALIGGAGAELTIDGGRLTVFNDNRPNGLEAAVSIRNAGQAMLNNLGGLGDGAIDIGADASLLLNPQANPPADADRTLTNTLTGAGTVIVDGSQTTSYTGIYADTDAGVVAIVSGANGGFTGVFDITDDDTLKLAAGADAASLGDPAAARIGTNASGALLFDGFEGEIANAIGGSGTVRADNGAKVSIDGDNAAGFTQRTGGVNTPVAGFSGLWDVQHGSTLTFEDANPANVANALGASASELAIDAASRAEIRTDGAFTFDHAIAQSEECLSPGEDGCANKAAPADSAGTLYAETGAGNAFAFSAAASAAAAANFAGTLELGASNFDLSGGNTAALAQSTLKIDAGNRTTVGAGTQNFYGLTFDGGAMVWDDFVPITSPAGHFVSVANLDVSGTGEVWAKRDPSYVYPHPGTVFNTPYLLEHDEGLAGTQLAAAANVTGTAGAIELLDSGTGLPFENAIPALPIDQPGHDGDAVAYGTYGLRLATAHANEMTTNPATGELELTPKNPVPTPDGLYVNYGLVQLDLQAGKTTWLYQRPGYGGLQADMSARIVGAGNLAIDALQGGTDTVSLSNARNAFTGTTTVVTGRLVTDADNALGQTSWLTVQPGAQATLTRFDGQGTAQNVGGLSAPAGARLIVDSGSTLNVVAAQRAAGGIGGLAGGDVGPGALDGAGRVTIAESWVNVEGAQPFGGVWQNGSGVDAASVSRFLNAASLAGAVENHAVVQVGGQDCCAPGVYAGTAPTTLTVAGWDGQDASTLWLGTFMGGDASDTDRLAIDGGAASGQTALAIAQRGGRGARTDVGILVIDALNGATTADDAFYLSELSTGYRRGGVKGPSLVAGPWEYRLVKGGNGGEAESWYLVAAPGYGPETGGHLENRRAAMALLTEHTFHDRQSHTFGQTDNANKQRAGWARVDHDVGSHELGGNLKSHAKIDRLHVGVDLWRADNRDGGEDKADFRFGAMYLHGQLDGKVKGIERKARNETRVDALGLYATWHQRPDQMTGGYVDAWLLAGRARNEVRGDGGPRDKHRARVAAASLEAGYAFVLDEGEKGRWLLEPEAQVIWGRYRAGSRTNKDGIDISGQSDTAVTTRLGARLMGERRRDDGRLLRPFAVANWWHGNASAAMAFDGEKARVNIPKNRAEFKIGVEGEVNKKLTLWGAVGAQTDFGRYRQGELQVGLRYRW